MARRLDERGERPLSLANLIMLGVAIVAFVAGAYLLARRGGSEPARVARRIFGTMLAALGIALAIFAIGLSGMHAEAAHA